MDVQLDGDWNTACLRCPACGSRDRFWAETWVQLAAHGGPTVLLAPDYSGRIECAACGHAAPFARFDPPWKAPTRRAVPYARPDEVCDVLEVRPLTVTDHVDQAVWLAGGPELVG